MSITIYSTDGCQACKATKRNLDAKQIPFDEINTSHDEVAADKARSYGFTQAPVVVVEPDTDGGEAQVWYGYRPDLLANLK